MIGITTYRDYFAKSNNRGSSKYESLCQLACDIRDTLQEDVEIVASKDIVVDGADFSKYSGLVLFEHPLSFVGRNGQAGFTTPNLEIHNIQLRKVLDFSGEVFTCNMEWQRPDIWTRRINARRKHPVTGSWEWPSDEQLFNMFEQGLKNSITKRVELTRLSRPCYSLGDSHTLMMWKPGSTAQTIPARTLNRVLREGLSTLVPEKAEQLTLCFGNIDLRHHLFRRPSPEESARELAKEYVKQAAELGLETKICELLPIIEPNRRVSKSYFYKGSPHFGETEERAELRTLFNNTLHEECAKHSTLSSLHCPNAIIGSDGLFAPDAVEKTTGGIHLSTLYYEWQSSTLKHQPEFTWLP